MFVHKRGIPVTTLSIFRTISPYSITNPKNVVLRLPIDYLPAVIAYISYWYKTIGASHKVQFIIIDGCVLSIVSEMCFVTLIAHVIYLLNYVSFEWSS